MSIDNLSLDEPYMVSFLARTPYGSVFFTEKVQFNLSMKIYYLKVQIHVYFF